MKSFSDNTSAQKDAERLHSEASSGSDQSSTSRLPSVTCTNCGQIHGGEFCPSCGQTVHLHQTLSAIGHDLIHGVLHLDGKLWDTLPLLIFRPGELTRRYIDGERVKFVSPMSMFLFTVFAMFAVFQIAGITAPADLTVETSLPEQMKQERVALERRIEELEKALVEAERSRRPSASIKAELANAEDGLRAYEGARTIILNEQLGAGITFTKVGIYIIDNAIDKWQSNPGLMMYKLQANAYKFSWLLIPLFIPFLSLLFLGTPQYNSYRHAVFVTYSLSFVSINFIVCSFISFIPFFGNLAFILLFVFVPLHLYVQLRQAYRLSALSALWRFIALMFAIVIVTLIFLLILGFIGAF